MLILGFNAYHGDVAAALLDDGRLVAALEEERFARIKHVAGFPAAAMAACLEMAGATPADVDVFAVARAKRAHGLRKALFALRHRPGLALVRQRLGTRARHQGLPETIAAAFGLDAGVVAGRLRHVEHHPAHLASAFYASGFDEAACCAIDGFGDFVSVSIGAGRGTGLDVLDRTYFPHSLGLLYLAVTQHLGFGHYGDEYKVMGLAPYGTPRHVEPLRRLLRLRPGGRFELALEYFSHWTGEVAMHWEGGAPHVPPVYSGRMAELIGPPRRPEDPVEPRHEDIAASLQVVFEDAVAHVLTGAHARVPHDRLCLAGGCAMNSVANGKIRARTPFREVYIQPAAGDNGTALGAALHVWHQELGRPRGLVMSHGYWGTAFDDEAVGGVIEASGVAGDGRARWTVLADEAALTARAAAHLADGRVLGWFQGRMEWGARALGNRSILADPRRADMREIINVKIKFRERFRPFAPSVLEEALDDYFVGAVPDPFMIQVYPVREDKRAVIPAVTHVDGSGRLQTVSQTTNPRYWALIRAFADRTGVPVLLNTSFNENEPIVQRPEEALDCFLRTDMDVLVLGSHVLEKPTVPGR
ncbi:MAG: carbamoyltransferase [Vicinamibacterales bacterium]